MSYRKEIPLYPGQLESLSAIKQGELYAGKSYEEITNLYLEILHNGIHGLCFSMYEDGQEPGDIISRAQVLRRMKILQPHIKWVRSFSCIEGNEYVPQVAKELGINTLVGAWLGPDKDKNEEEIEALIDLAQKGYVDIAAVGNEVLYREDLTEAELLGYIRQVKKAIPDVPVGYVDAYYEFTQHPSLVEVSDVILCNCYPFWEGCPFDNSLHHMQAMYAQAQAAAQGKKIIITETGWPSHGESMGEAHPSEDHALRYFLNTQLWAMDAGIEVFYFSSFDESWKVGPEGDVGAHWGLWDKHEKLKFVNKS